VQWIKERKDGITAEVKVQPQASKNELIIQPHWLKVKLVAPPVEGKANRALLEFLADCFCVDKRSVQILKGARSQHKTVLFKGVSKAVFISGLKGGR
jgi:uncharacterized protein (TIGR00251 family)